MWLVVSWNNKRCGAEASLTVSSRASLNRPLRLLWRKALEFPVFDSRILARRAFCKEHRNHLLVRAYTTSYNKMIGDLWHCTDLSFNVLDISVVNSLITPRGATAFSLISGDKFTLIYLWIIYGNRALTQSLGWEAVRAAAAGADKSGINQESKCHTVICAI